MRSPRAKWINCPHGAQGICPRGLEDVDRDRSCTNEGNKLVELRAPGWDELLERVVPETILARGRDLRRSAIAPVRDLPNDLALVVENGASAHRLTLTFGGGAPNTASPSTTISREVPVRLIIPSAAMASVSGPTEFSGEQRSTIAPTVCRSHSSLGSFLTSRVVTHPTSRSPSTTGNILKWWR